ncbi:hypothetical protein ACEQ8H_004191 [Pleosporales sp. CAS-2024a]
MSIKQHYYPNDFVDYAMRHCPDEYLALCSSPDWIMESKISRTQHGILFRAPMLLVGRPFYHDGLQTAWACSDGSTIAYYYGQRHEDFLHPMRDLFTNKIYFDPPLSHMAGNQETKGMTKGRREGRALAELVIRVMSQLLQGGFAYRITNFGAGHVLSDFKFACLSFGSAIGMDCNGREKQDVDTTDQACDEVETNPRTSGEYTAPRGDSSAKSDGCCIKDDYDSDHDHRGTGPGFFSEKSSRDALYGRLVTLHVHGTPSVARNLPATLSKTYNNNKKNTKKKQDITSHDDTFETRSAHQERPSQDLDAQLGTERNRRRAAEKYAISLEREIKRLRREVAT